ncbi:MULTISPECIES: phage holin family protein [unclassified Ruegeria]|uniref:phage holin family protein n=1 Tax=unclassified Ruegeria TaxID=2625375 RepID=UPI0014806644|nr:MULTISPECIES: phage holin family protein [unclassified Ruegeria]
MNRISRNISIVLRSERLIAQRHLAVLRRQTGLMAAAGIAAGVGLIMLNVAAFFALSDMISRPAAALIVALVNLALAVLLVALANNSKVAEETAPVAEVRDMALEDIEAELRVAAEEARSAADALKKMARDPLGTFAPGLAGSVAKAVIKNLKT